MNISGLSLEDFLRNYAETAIAMIPVENVFSFAIAKLEEERGVRLYSSQDIKSNFESNDAFHQAKDKYIDYAEQLNLNFLEGFFNALKIVYREQERENGKTVKTFSQFKFDITLFSQELLQRRYSDTD